MMEGPTWRDERPHLERHLRREGYKFLSTSLTWVKLVHNEEITVADSLLDALTLKQLNEVVVAAERAAAPKLTW
jgi:hypothetical protein